MKRFLSILLSLALALALLPAAVVANEPETVYNVQVTGGTAVFVDKTEPFDGAAHEGDVLEVSLTPQDGRTLKYWRSINGQTVPGERFRMTVCADELLWPVFTDTADSPFGDWAPAQAILDCTQPVLFKRENGKGDVEYKWDYVNDGMHSMDYSMGVELDASYHTVVCSVCGYEETQPHQWADPEILQPASHTADGQARYVCAVCGAVKDEAIPKTEEHAWGAWEIVTPSVHGQPGVRRRSCACGAQEDYWYIDADWESFLHESRVSYEKSWSDYRYADQRGNKYEQLWQYQNADGNSTWLYSTHFLENDEGRLVLFLWSDQPDALGRRPIYHAKDMTGGGYDWAVVRYADTYEDFIRFIDYLYGSNGAHSSNLIDLLTRYETMYNQQMIPADQSSNWLGNQSDWSFSNNSVFQYFAADGTWVELPTKMYENSVGDTFILDPATGAVLEYHIESARLYDRVEGIQLIISEEAYNALEEDGYEQMMLLHPAQLADGGAEGLIAGIDCWNQPVPHNYLVCVDGWPEEGENGAALYENPERYYERHIWNVGLEYVTDYRDGDAHDIEDYGIVRTLTGPNQGGSGQYTVTLRPAAPEGWTFLRWEIYDWQNQEWVLFNETDGAGNICLNYSEANGDGTAFVVDHRLTDIALVRARFEAVPEQAVHIQVVGGTYDRVIETYPYGREYHGAEGEVALGAWVCPVDDGTAPAGKRFDHWELFVDGVLTPIVWEDTGLWPHYDYVVATGSSMEFRAVYVDAEYYVDAYAEHGKVLLDGVEFYGGQYTAGTVLNLNTQGEEGYPLFLGWYLMSGKGMHGYEWTLVGKETALSYTVSGETHLEARWAESEPAEELVTVLVDGGFARYEDPQTGLGNGFSALLLAEPTTMNILDDPSDGAAILGWTVDYTDSNETAHSDTLAADQETGRSADLAIQGYDDYAADNKTVAVTGTREEIPNYTLSFVTGTDESLEPITAPAGATITLPVPSYEGHSFVGWFRDENFWTPFNETVMPAENLTLYAKWAELPILIQGAVVTEGPGSEMGYDITVPVSLPSGKSAEELKVTVAVYSAEGQLLELVFAELAGGEEALPQFSARLQGGYPNGASLRIFALRDGTWAPLAESATEELPGG